LIRASSRIDAIRPLALGIVLSAAIGLLATRLGTIDWLQTHGISALTAAIVIGVLVGNTLYPRFAASAGAGVSFSKQTVLRAGVILYGLRVTLHDVGQVGITGVLIDVAVLTSTFGVAVLFGTRVVRLDRATSVLIGAGSAICGAAAVMATEPVVRAKAEQVTLAISTVVIFGTLAIFLYPALYALGHGGPLHIQSHAFGIYAGSTIHEVAQVLAVGRSVNDAVANTAVITKMVRVMLLAPFLICLSAWLDQHTASRSGKKAAPRIAIPWFVLAFIALVAFNSLAWLPSQLVNATTSFDNFLLATAMAALGLTTHISAVRNSAAKPLVLGAVLFVWLIVGGGLINLLAERVW
jgi:uncharacterized integral membrane protein (TIGR00698 family)